MGEIILPLLRYSNAPKVHGCRVQLQKTAPMAKWHGTQCHIPYIRDALCHSQSLRIPKLTRPANRLDDSQRTNPGIQNGIDTVCLIF